jgi:hypothetical protein
MSLIKKFLGLILLFLGLAVIFYGLYSSYNIFTAKTAAPQIFNLEKQSSSQSSGAQAQLEETISQQLKGMFPTDSVPKLLNLLSWSVFAGILIFGGSQIATLGIKLIK